VVLVVVVELRHDDQSRLAPATVVDDNVLAPRPQKMIQWPRPGVGPTATRMGVNGGQLGIPYKIKRFYEQMMGCTVHHSPIMSWCHHSPRFRTIHSTLANRGGAPLCHCHSVTSCYITNHT
jgi:hypothetical protein